MDKKKSNSTNDLAEAMKTLVLHVNAHHSTKIGVGFNAQGQVILYHQETKGAYNFDIYNATKKEKATLTIHPITNVARSYYDPCDAQKWEKKPSSRQTNWPPKDSPRLN